MRTALKHTLDDAGLGEQIGAEQFYPTVRAAVQGCVSEQSPHDNSSTA